MWARHAPSGFGWTRLQSLWVAAFVAAMSFAPARCAPDPAPRDRSADPRPPGSWVLYDDLLEVNAASVEDLERLPGIGPALARRIAAHREAKGGFCDAAEIAALVRVGDERWIEINRRIRVEESPGCAGGASPGVSPRRPSSSRG